MNGFTNNNSKGLFTFYKEQSEAQYNLRIFKPLETITKINQVSLAYPTTKRPNNSVKQQPKLSYRYKEEESIGKPHIYTSKHIFSLNFNSPRKNGYHLQLLAARYRKIKTQVGHYNKKEVTAKLNNRYLIGELSVRQIHPRELKQLFQPKKDYLAKLSSARRNPIKINAISGRCIQNEEVKVVQKNKNKSSPHNLQKLKNIQSKKSPLASTLFKDVLQIRKQRLNRNGFLQEIKSRQKNAYFNINKKLQQWASLDKFSSNSQNQKFQDHIKQ